MKILFYFILFFEKKSQQNKRERAAGKFLQEGNIVHSVIVLHLDYNKQQYNQIKY